MSVDGEWRPDPTGRYAWRWWQGEWTDSVGHDGKVCHDAYPYIVSGRDSLDVVGESHRQEAIRRLVGTSSTDRVSGHQVLAYLVPEPTNPHDPNAVRVDVAGLHVGYLPRGLAAVVQPVVTALQAEVGAPIAVTGEISGGGAGADGRSRDLGVFLRTDARRLGLRRSAPRSGSPDTGMGTALARGGFDWLGEVPTGHVEAIRMLRQLLEEVDLPVERHFIHLELIKRLYKLREDFDSALEAFDDACEAHHAEMASIRPELLRLGGGHVPQIPTYRQAAIRQAKAKDFSAALRWALRGLEIYGEDCLDPANRDDLQKRADSYRKKLPGAI